MNDFGQDIARLTRWQQTLLNTYEAVFGSQASDAFAKYVRARQVGIPVVLDTRNPPVHQEVTSMPAPCPLSQAVAAGVFGEEDSGETIDPSADEIAELTQTHYERMVELTELLQTTDDPTATSNQLKEAVEFYADDFGQDAADALLAHCHRKALLNTVEVMPKLCR